MNTLSNDAMVSFTATLVATLSTAGGTVAARLGFSFLAFLVAGMSVTRVSSVLLSSLLWELSLSSSPTSLGSVRSSAVDSTAVDALVVIGAFIFASAPSPSLDCSFDGAAILFSCANLRSLAARSSSAGVRALEEGEDEEAAEPRRWFLRRCLHHIPVTTMAKRVVPATSKYVNSSREDILSTDPLPIQLQLQFSYVIVVGFCNSGTNDLTHEWISQHCNGVRTATTE